MSGEKCGVIQCWMACHVDLQLGTLGSSKASGGGWRVGKTT